MIINEHVTQRWSYSKIMSYEHCPYEFNLNYIVNDDEIYLSESNYYAEIGSYVHEILAMILTDQLDIELAAEYFIDHYDDHVFYHIKKETMHKIATTVIDYFANLDRNQLVNYDILGVEIKQEFYLGEYKFVGFIDLLLRDKRDGRIVVVDHKSTEYPFTKNGGVKKKLQTSFEQYKKQMYLYAHAVYESFGEYPKVMAWNHFKDQGSIATIDFDKKEYDEIMQWFQDKIREIQKDELFDPRPDYFYCHNLCNYRHSCEYSVDSEFHPS